ncbi:dGTPase [Hydrogenimonas cancrithermarum]|uniref:Deoxyguanosinetriphosphate triphosphohydrolase n=1 Tax=Hydrogenimonas cancrithermarum TaxID=2993563 RepID=A0ABN6WTT3_9BACT|nr:dGTPase [Hydrogenimonas cancrithermarum]BDY12515.1 putative deoxyguanosinetriphosphate triphosphohydrolase [Hydrogenimonas cancrithermarum]
MIDYRKKLTTDRKLYPIDDIEDSFESDRGRIMTSPAFRRLQKRTQVFALELNAAVRSRLTHSLEVQQTSRFIARTVLKKLRERGGLEACGLAGLEHAFVSVAEMAALLHDIGNPPFGHFAEEAINTWVATEAPGIVDRVLGPAEESRAFRQMLLDDLASFDGNAQAIRMVEKLQRLNLSYSQTAAVLKYTRGAFEAKPPRSDELSYLKKKPGFYYAEKGFVEEMTKALSMAPGARFPITYIMEAADDISYLTADLEDAVDKGILSLDEVYRLILEESRRMNEMVGSDERWFEDVVERLYKKAQKDDKPYRFNLFLTLMRAELTRGLVEHVAQNYLDNHQAVFDGRFNHALLELDPTSPYGIAVDVLRNISIRHIYQHREVETLELKGHAILMGLLNLYRPILEIPAEALEKLCNDEKVDTLLAQKLFRRLPQKHIVAYQKSVESIDASMDGKCRRILEWYYRMRLLLDYISGMTDDFALKEFQELSAISL